MSAPPIFPTFPGLGWSVRKSPCFSTLIATHVSGREVRLPLYADPLWDFELTIDALAANGAWPGLGAQSFQALLGFYLECQGQFAPFVYVDPADCTATGASVGAADGVSTVYPLRRAVGPFVETVSWATALSAVHLDGAAQASGWSLAPPNEIVFAAPPAAGAAITADFTYGYLCRFLSDRLDLENFAAGLWKVNSLKFRSVRT